MGFARRFATYKRPNLLLRDPERLARILTNREHPVQLVLAGKAHPADLAGQAMIQQWHQFLKRPDVQSHVAFLADYDMLLSQQLVQGVDLWINTPRRPWEASGTSGMKILANGGMNLSELDGWWAEAYSPEVGWAIGDGKEHGDDPNVDAAEAEALYALLEREIVPKFYQRDEQGIPTQWIAMMRESMARLTPVFSANRTVREYTEKHYLPGAAAYCSRAAEHGKAAAELLEWQRALSENWPHIRFGQLHVETRDGQHLFEVQVYLDDVSADARARGALCRFDGRRSADPASDAARARAAWFPRRLCLLGVGACHAAGRAITRRAWFLSKPAHSCRWRRTKSYGSDEIQLSHRQLRHRARESDQRLEHVPR